MKKLIVALLLTVSAVVYSQDKIAITQEDYNNDQVEMADAFRSEGKIYVVVSIVLVIMLGLLGYTMHIDRKLGKLEKESGLEE